jgi:hypothetical protein
VGVRQLGDPEVHDLDRAVVQEPDVRGLDVTVHDVVLVGELQPAADLDHHVELLGQEQRLSGAEQGLQIPAGQELHRDVRHPAILAQLEHGHDVRVLQLGRGPGLDLEAGPALLFEVALNGQGLHGDVAVQPFVVAAVDLAHPALADTAGDHVLPDARPGLLQTAGRGIHTAHASSNRTRSTVMLSSPPF